MTGPSHLDLRFLFGAFVAIAVTFAVTTAYTQYAMARVDAASDQIAYDTAPSIAHLTAARTAVRQVELQLERARASGDRGAEDVERALAQVNAEAHAYLELPTFPGEKELWRDIEESLDRFNRAIHRALAQVDLGPARQRRNLLEVGVAADRVIEAISRDIEFNAQNGRDLALQIKKARRDAAWAGYLLAASCVALTILAGLLVRRQVRRYGMLVERHAELQELRASELETFAGRAAHDILNPVAATQMALQLAVRRSAGDPNARELLDRALRNVLRVRTIVDGLLQFARAGAQPPAGVSADVASVVEDALAGVRPFAEGAGLELSAEPLPRATVACSAGVLTSLVSNLLHNAIKHAGDRSGGRATLRALERGDLVRVEVEDTGPGIPADALEDIFLPYVRGPGAGKEGLGLGLATVRRLAEAHGGAAGVRSALGEGSVFWFELPRADEAGRRRSAARAAEDRAAGEGRGADARSSGES